MWTCPQCGRTFKKQEHSHYCGKAPDAEERISWSMPVYRKKHNIIQFAGFKNHVGLYPGGGSYPVG